MVFLTPPPAFSSELVLPVFSSCVPHRSQFPHRWIYLFCTAPTFFSLWHCVFLDLRISGVFRGRWALLFALQHPSNCQSRLGFRRRYFVFVIRGDSFPLGFPLASRFSPPAFFVPLQYVLRPTVGEALTLQSVARSCCAGGIYAFPSRFFLIHFCAR